MRFSAPPTGGYPLLRCRIVFENEVTSTNSGRPAPVQRRGVERVQAVLEAAEGLLIEHGYEAATLKAISARTGIPLASIYHYFRDRHQVDAELARRHAERLEDRITAALGNPVSRNLREAVDVMFDLFLAYYREHPDFVELWYVGRGPIVAEVAQVFDTTQAGRLRSYLIDRGFLCADAPALVLELAFEAGNRLLDIAFHVSRAGDDVIVEEARRLVTAYLATYAPRD